LTLSLNGKIALITGAGRGIGRAVALHLADAGVDVALVARSLDELEEVADRVSERGRKALVIQADLGQRQEIARIVDRVHDGLGAVDVLVNNAAVVWPIGPSVEVDLDEWAAAMDINVRAVAALTFALLPDMIERGWGRVVNVSSGVVAYPSVMVGANAYATSKAALEGHTLSLAAELAGTGVTVNAYRPGGVDTEMQAWIRGRDPEDIGSELHNRFNQNFESGALLTPDASAKALVDHLGRTTTGEIWDVSDPAGDGE
jgi:NAD(P)-dependent dehydrogenase (short-subunit alcohol dehydrogenase family)